MGTERTSNASALLLILVGLAFWAAFQSMGSAFNDYALGLGSTRFPSPLLMRFALQYGLLGSAGAICIAVGITRWLQTPLGEPKALPWFVAVTTAIGVILPAALRYWVLEGAPVTDDEAVYRFSARLLASGQLTGTSHPMKLFFDHAFMVNDGNTYSQYFLGWPAIMALGVPFKATGYLNAILSGATIPALYRLLKSFSDVRWARLGVLIFLTSPMLQIAAATEMSHTSALFALTYAVMFADLALRRSGPHASAGFGFFLALAFFIRPLSAVGVGLPWGVMWLRRQLRSNERAGANIAAFCIPAFTLAALFLITNAKQTGSPLVVAYQGAFEYGIENGFRFTHVVPERMGHTPNFAGWNLPEMLGTTTTALIRLNISLFGWPLSFAFLPAALGLRRASLWWASLGTYALVHLNLVNPGVDTFGPVHFFEMSLAVLALTVLGGQRVTGWAAQLSPSYSRLPAALAVAFVLGSVFLFSPYRLRAIGEIATMTREPVEVVKRANIHNAVIFANSPWAMNCHPAISRPPRHFVFWWPVNSPDFDDDVIWANHLSTRQDQKLMTAFPDRRGYVAVWRMPWCKMELIPVEEAEGMELPNGLMGIYGGSRRRYSDEHLVTGELPEESR
jgi:hypothetical protein